MKIKGLRTVLVEVPLDKPIATAIHDISSISCVLVWLDTDVGISGESYMFTFSLSQLEVLDAMVRSLEPLVVGQDVHHVEKIFDDMWHGVNFIGHKGVSIFAMSAIDTACWDILGKAQGLPLYKLFGACRTSVPAYASGGLWLSMSVDQLVAEAESFLEAGFKAMKIRVGKKNVEEDLERVAAVRQTIGADTALMADANQGLSVSHAIRLGRGLEEFGLTWFEEPVPYYDLVGHAQITAALDMPIASGETEYTRYGMRDMIEAKACDILMPDLQRIGGLTEFRRVTALAAAHDMPVSPHIFSEQSLAIAGSAPNVNFLEYMPWFAPLYTESMRLSNGNVVMPEAPGTGFTFATGAIEKYRLR